MTCRIMEGKTGYKGQKYVVYVTFSLGSEPPAEHVFGWQNEPRGGLLESVRLNPSMKNGRITLVTNRKDGTASGLIGNDFVPKTYATAQRCSECRKSSCNMLVSIRKGKVRKKVCSEECRLKFDNRFWQEKADQRERS